MTTSTKELKKVETNGASKEAETTSAEATPPTSEDKSLDINKDDLANVPKIFTLARQQVVGNKESLAQVMNYEEILIAKLTKLVTE